MPVLNISLEKRGQLSRRFKMSKKKKTQRNRILTIYNYQTSKKKEISEVLLIRWKEKQMNMMIKKKKRKNKLNTSLNT